MKAHWFCWVCFYQYVMDLYWHVTFISIFERCIWLGMKTADRPIYQPGQYIVPIFWFWPIYCADILGFTDISLSANCIGLIRCWQNAVIFLMHPENLHKKAHQSKSRQLSCSNASRCIFVNRQTRWNIKHASAITAETKALSSIRL